MRTPAIPAVALFSSLALAQEIPLTNWTVPPYTHTSTGTITTMTDATPPRAFIGIQPCRVADTRGNGAPIQGPIFPDGGLRTWDLTGICGIPSGADAISANFTVTGSPSAPPGAFLLAWPTGGPPPPVSILNFQAGQTVANAAIVPLGPSEQIQVNVSHSTHVILDVNGYFSDQIANQTNDLYLANNDPGSWTALFQNASNVNNSVGVYGTAGPVPARPSYQAAGVRGEGRFGTLGISQEYGAAGSLVSGGAEVAFGILGFRVDIGDPEVFQDNTGVFGYTGTAGGGDAGVVGYAPAATGITYGVHGLIGSETPGAAGVRGQDGGGPVGGPTNPLENPAFHRSAGVRGESHANDGVVGLTHLGRGVLGMIITGSATVDSFGILGCSPSDGVCGSSAIVTGNTSFVEPHPSDPAKMIRYSAVQGGESGTYFRGRGKFQNGIAVIEVPEDFRTVTDPEGLSIQVTPIGQMASFAVESIGLNRIVVRGSRNVEFFYHVNGIRHAYRDSGPIADNQHMFVPASAADRIPTYLPESLRQRLIANGTYAADGTVNMETARRMGWDKKWESRLVPESQAVP